LGVIFNGKERTDEFDSVPKNIPNRGSLAHDKRGVSATYLASELGIAYQTAWTIQHKVRKAMGDRDSFYVL
jgi:hypothetical protein